MATTSVAFTITVTRGTAEPMGRAPRLAHQEQLRIGMGR